MSLASLEKAGRRKFFLVSQVSMFESSFFGECRGLGALLASQVNIFKLLK